MLRAECVKECSTSFYSRSSRGGSGFFGGMKQALTGAVQSLTPSTSSKERCRAPVMEKALDRRSCRSAAPTPVLGSAATAAPSTTPSATSAPSEPTQPASQKAPEPQPSEQSKEQAPKEPNKESQPSKPGQPESSSELLEARDYTQVPKQLDEQFEKLDPDARLMSCAGSWSDARKHVTPVSACGGEACDPLEPR